LSLSPGQAFGNYRILSRIGVGGMGMVFLAEHPHIGKRVALKIIHRDLAGHEEVVKRFLNEARAVNQIGSDHIVQIHDFGQTEAGEHFFIMEYLDGCTLAQALADGALEVGRALHIGAQIAGALTAAHDTDIIHRDLKPDNVMLIRRLGDDDFVKLLDFGLAKFLSEADARKLTAAGVVLGTPHYMSPEACESKPNVDHRCDVYSLGVLLFQMTTGQLPFTGGTMGEVLIKQVVQPPPPPRSLAPHVPPAVEQVILRCLAKNPAARFQRMRELRDSLADLGKQVASAPSIDPDSADTLLVDDGLSGAGARASAPSALLRSEQPTELEVGTGGRWPGRADAPTAYMDEAAHRQYGGYARSVRHERSQSRDGGHAGLRAHETRPGGAQAKRTWPMVVAILLAGVAAGVVAFLIARPDSPAPVLAGKTVSQAPSVARIRLTTRPSGAAVSDANGKHLGTTPTDLVLPIDGRQVVLRFRHAAAIDSEKRFVPTRDMAFDIELPPRTVPDQPADDDSEAAREPEEKAATKAAAKRTDSSSARKSRKASRRKAEKRRQAKASKSDGESGDKSDGDSSDKSDGESADKSDQKSDDELLRPEI
jgi:eukaryotic-like serine/threonine-protein kinase